MAKPRILVTNDDGIMAPGIRALLEVVKDLGEITLVAPNSPQSGQGHAITIEDPIRLHKVDLMPGIEAYECSGTPVDCVKLAQFIKAKENKRFDLCVSGINHGSNASINIIYSGTMSAAMEASLEGIPSVGFSLTDYSWGADFSAAKHYARIIIEKVLQNGLSNCNLLNVNFPRIPLNEIKGMKVCKQGEARWEEAFQESLDPRGQTYYWLMGKFVNNDSHPDSDVNALANGYVSIVPSGHDLTKYDAIDSLKNILL